MLFWAELVAGFEQEAYFVNETDTEFEICVLVEGLSINDSLILLVKSESNNSTAEGTIIHSRLHFKLQVPTHCSHRLAST